MNLLMQIIVFRVVIRTFQINTPTLYKNNECEAHKNAFGASSIGQANAFLCFGFLFGTLCICVFAFEIAKIELPTVFCFQRCALDLETFRLITILSYCNLKVTFIMFQIARCLIDIFKNCAPFVFKMTS